MNVDFASLADAPGERLHSLRNEVVRLITPCGTVIRKRYRLAGSYEHEMAQLHFLHSCGLLVPCVLYHQSRLSFLEDVGSLTYVDVLDMFPDDNAFEGPVGALADFLFAYYDASKVLRGDVNLRNFIYRDGLCFGLDFEEPQIPGFPEQDFGRMLAFMLTYKPAFCQKRIAAAHALWKNCLARGLCPSRLRRHMQDEFYAMRDRRRGFSPLYDKALAFAPQWEGFDA